MRFVELHMPNAGVVAGEQVLRALQERLKETQAVHPRVPTPQFSVESCSLAVLALRNHRSPEYMGALHALIAARNRDGSWPAFSGDDTEGCWVLALMADRRTLADVEFDGC
jgi:hypothetical protein